MAGRDNELDKMLAELGVGPGADLAGMRPAKKPDQPAPRRHALDTEASNFAAPLSPTGQGNRAGVSAGSEVRPAAPAGGAVAAVDLPQAPPSAPKAAPPAHVPGMHDVGKLLIYRNLITQAQLSAAEQVVKQTPGKSLEQTLVEQGVDEAKVQDAVAELAGLPFERIDLVRGLDGGFDGTLLQRITAEFCKKHMILPLRSEGSRVVVGVVRPSDVFIVDELKRRLGCAAIKLVVVTSFEIRGALELSGDKSAGRADEPDVSEILKDVGEGDVQVEKKHESEVDLEKEAGGGPVIRYVNHIIHQAVKEGASDIHIEPAEAKLKVRFRIDGELYEMMQPPPSMAAAITSRLKIMANLDISERRLPQDGRIRCTVQSRKLDLRMSTLPVTGGEKVVMRILDTRSINVKLEDLGFDENTLVRWKNLINLPHGIVLVTGPTGSGKTTTLYSSIRQLDKNSMNISTVEDPVEYHLDGINQTQTHEKIGMTFAKALKALLRQDPDVIMVGEIRDLETAVTAVQAALTGHLVLSTLHTNDAPSSITRLINIGVEPFLVAAAINGVLAQRLLRRLCKHCKHEAAPNDEMLDFLRVQGLSTEKVWTPKGCERCRNGGYSGRLGIYELLSIDDSMRDFVVKSPNVAEFRRLCMEKGMVTLRADGLVKAVKGATSIEEVLRVTEATI